MILNKILIAFLMSILIFSGCSSSKPSTNPDMPGWFLNPPSSSDFYYGVGSAKKQNPSLAKKVAATRARTEISEAVKTEVSSLISDFMQESGIGENAQATEFNESVSKSVSNNVLSNNTIKEVFSAPDGTIYVMVEMPKDAVKQESLRSARREEALFNQFKAEQGFDKLEAALEDL